MNVTFYGVRGSTPCACDSTRRYGGNTSCVVLNFEGGEPIVFDLGTGLRFFGLDIGCGEPFKGAALVSHLHWDHVQGIPFFAPWLVENSRLDMWAPQQDGIELEDAVRAFICPPYFPIDIDQLPGELRFHEAGTEPFMVGRAEVIAAPVPHIGPTVGYRVTVDGISVAYVSDHQQPGPGSTEVDPAVLELCRDVDLLIHDAQFNDEEFAARPTWGHCTVDYAVEVAAQSGARRLALFHHDPSHSDDQIDELLAQAKKSAAARGILEVIAAGEGTTVSLSAESTRADAAASSVTESITLPLTEASTVSITLPGTEASTVPVAASATEAGSDLSAR